MFKDKTIVYDEVNGHWFNLDGDEDDLAPAVQPSMVTRREYDTIWLLSKVRYFFFYSVSHQPHACPPHRHLGPSCSHLHLDMMLVSPQLPHLIYSARKDTSRLNL